MHNDEVIYLVRGMHTQTGEHLYVGVEQGARGRVHTSIASIENASPYRVDDLDGITSAVAHLRLNPSVPNRTIEVLIFRLDQKPFDDAEYKALLEKMALAVLSKSEIEALGVMPRAIYHRLAGDL